MYGKTLKQLAVLMLFVAGCGPQNFVYQAQSNTRLDREYPVKTITSANAVDMVWVIDNSGSMDTYQQQVIFNAGNFMKEFIQQGVNWKIGVLSTDENSAPYAGFKGAAPLDSSILNPVTQFSSVVNSLGTWGSGTEKTFKPILTALKNDPTFLRAGVPTVFIMITDAEEQSYIDASVFLQELALYTQDRSVYAYGAFAAADFGCTSSDSNWNYKRSPYETFISGVKGGQAFPICKDFGKSLADLGHEIVTRISRSAIYLTKRPDLSTLKVYYHGEELKPGLQSEGGYWMYDYRLNAVVFHSVEFAKNDEDSVRVVFDEGEGI